MIILIYYLSIFSVTDEGYSRKAVCALIIGIDGFDECIKLYFCYISTISVAIQLFFKVKINRLFLHH